MATPAASAGRVFSEEIIELLKTRGGLLKEEIEEALGTFGVRFDRALQALDSGGRVERALDRREDPPGFRYWLKGEKPPGWGATHQAAKPAGPELEKDAPVEAAPPARQAPDPTPIAKPKLEKGERPWSEVALQYVAQHPGAMAKDLTDIGVPSAGNILGQHVRRGKLRTEGEEKQYRYWFVKPEDRAPSKQTSRSPPDSLRNRIHAYVEKKPDLTSREIATALDLEDVNRVANELSSMKREGRVRAEGRARSFRFFPAKAAKEPPAPKKAKRVAPPRARAHATKSQGVDLDELEAAIARVRAAQNALAAAEADLRAVVGGAP